MPMVRSFKFSFSREEGCLLKVMWKLQRGRAWDVKSWEFLVNITKANFLQALAILSTLNTYHCNHVGNRGSLLTIGPWPCEKMWTVLLLLYLIFKCISKQWNFDRVVDWFSIAEMDTIIISMFYLSSWH